MQEYIQNYIYTVLYIDLYYVDVHVSDILESIKKKIDNRKYILGVINILGIGHRRDN